MADDASNEQIEQIKPISRADRDKTSPCWDMSQECAFMETLSNQRFNFFLVFFAAVVAGAANAKTNPVLIGILAIGLLVASLLFWGLRRVFHKLDIIIEYLYQDTSHPASLVNSKAKVTYSVRPLYALWIPLTCLIVLFAAFIASICGWIEPPGKAG